MISFYKCLVLFVLAQSGFTAIAADANSEGKSFADSVNSNMGGITGDFDPTQAVTYEGTDVKETQYYNSAGSIEEEATQFSTTDPTSQYMTESYNVRPTVNLDEKNDPLFKTYDEIKALSYSLAENYEGCVDLPVGADTITTIENKSCYLNTTPVTKIANCSREIDGYCEVGDDDYEFTVYGAAMQYGGGFKFRMIVDLKTGNYDACMETFAIGQESTWVCDRNYSFTGYWFQWPSNLGEAVDNTTMGVLLPEKINYGKVCGNQGKTELVDLGMVNIVSQVPSVRYWSWWWNGGWSNAKSVMSTPFNHPNSKAVTVITEPNCSNNLVGVFEIAVVNPQWVEGKYYYFNANLTSRKYSFGFKTCDFKPTINEQSCP